MNSNEVLGVQDTIFVLWEEFGVSSANGLDHGSDRISYLSCSVDNLSCIILTIVLNNPAEGILDGRIVAFDEVVFDKTDREGRFA
jgi:hypothetical protein